MIAAILCGGEGTRLRPLTYAVPKPLLPLGSKPILEVTISRMKEQGFNTFYLMVNYKADMISSYFGTGLNFGVDIRYIQEKTKRGTAGPLADLCDLVDQPFVAMNADLLTNIDFVNMMKFHKKQDSDLTVALKRFDRKVAFGVVEVDSDSIVKSLQEKPTVSFLINSGIYIVNPEILHSIPKDTLYNMTDLINDSVKAGKSVQGYQFTEPWRDIGRLDDYMKVISDIENGLESDTDGVFI
ncbi:MAG: sugar phosphate nucleotidyltransferase [Candidatus Thorarchaeota archaeon]|nr:sugar phosphate nucleotidyltransferase [Candidatus Thorarchaeota archaeon]